MKWTCALSFATGERFVTGGSPPPPSSGRGVGLGLGWGALGDDGDGGGVGVSTGICTTITGIGCPAWMAEGLLGRSSVIVWQATRVAAAIPPSTAAIVRRIRTP